MCVAPSLFAEENMEYLLMIDEDDIEKYAQHYFREHPRARKYPIANPYHPSINEWMIMQRPEMNGTKQKWKDFMVWLVHSQGYANLRIEKCDIEVFTYYRTNRPHDPDNSVPKFILDGLVEAEMIIRDDHRHVLSLKLQCGVDRDNPRTEIKIIVKENNDGE